MRSAVVPMMQHERKLWYPISLQEVYAWICQYSIKLVPDVLWQVS